MYLPNSNWTNFHTEKSIIIYKFYEKVFNVKLWCSVGAFGKGNDLTVIAFFTFFVLLPLFLAIALAPSSFFQFRYCTVCRRRFWHQLLASIDNFCCLTSPPPNTWLSIFFRSHPFGIWLRHRKWENRKSKNKNQKMKMGDQALGNFREAFN